ncbi:helix-turn-helix domain-containing protein [Emcibacter sp. SYSU 3D8]|uniref:TetR/AcrR family transcriptional regulator n=1 Tax=Emcibacter sp. SYSU 3D8 TaxID=3133969 RepID=UPI0031FF3982
MDRLASFDHSGAMATMKPLERRPRRWLTRRGESARETILRAAVACFVEVGYARTTMSEVAKHAGVTRGQVQHHFATTRDLLLAAVRWLHAEIGRELDESLAQAAGRDIVETAVVALWNHAGGPMQTAARELTAAARTDAGLRQVLDESRAGIEGDRNDRLRHLYREVIELDPEGFAMLADYMEVFLHGLSETAFATDDAARKRALLEFFMANIRRFWTDRGKSAALTPKQVGSRAASSRGKPQLQLSSRRRRL